MLSLPPRRLVCALALSLLCLPLLARAQTPLAKPDAVPQVRLHVEFTTASARDVKGIGVVFDALPLTTAPGTPMPKVMQIKTASGNIVNLLRQTLMRTRGKVDSVPDVVVPDKTTTKVLEDAQIRYFPPDNGVSHRTFNEPIIKKNLQTSLSITPRINSDSSVTLVFVPLNGDLNAPPKALKVPAAKTVSSGQVILLAGLPLNREKPTDDQELLVFVTPTILSANGSPIIPKPAAASVVNTGEPQPTVPDTAESKTREKAP